MAQAMRLIFTVCLLSCATVATDWVEVPVIGHRPNKGIDEEHVRSSSATNAKVMSRTTNVPFTTQQPIRAKTPSSGIKLGQAIPATKTANKVEEIEPPEFRTNPSLPVDEFMRAHETLSRYGAGSVVEKVNFLDQLKRRLLRKAAELMPRAIIALSGHSPSAATSEGRGHKGIGFPSSEGTLMSLCFLVFAVFLVKIVIQLIQGLQNNTFGVVTSTARTARARADWMGDHSEEEILRLLENLQVILDNVFNSVPRAIGASKYCNDRRQGQYHGDIHVNR